MTDVDKITMSDRVSETVRRFTQPGEVLTAHLAAGALQCSIADLQRASERGELTSLYLHGDLYLLKGEVFDLISAKSDKEHELLTEALVRNRSALFHYVNTATLTEIIPDPSPLPFVLVTARRGDPDTFRRFGLSFHSLVVQAREVMRWTQQRDPKAAALFPTLARFREQLLSLPGVSPAFWVTPLGTPGRARRLTGWVRIDPAVFPPARMAPAVAAETGYADGLVALPPGMTIAEYGAAADPAASVDDEQAYR